MEFKDIDSMFEDAAKRLKGGVNPTAAYGEPPLASDHFLLKRSWEFFQKRLKAMEDHWVQITSAKETAIQALLKAQKESGEEFVKMKDRANETEEIDLTLVSGRLEDQRSFAADLQSLRETFEQERESLERRITDAESLKNRIRKEAESRLSVMQAEILELRASLSKASEEIAEQAGKRLVADGTAAETVLKRDEVIKSLESKVELLKSELARREQLQRDSTDRAHALSRDHQLLEGDNRSANSELNAAHERIDDLEVRLRSARMESDALRDARKQEQAEWRELWERAREMWELERKNNRSV